MTRTHPIAGLSVFTGAAGRARAVAGDASEATLFEQVSDTGTWIVGRTLTAPTSPGGLSITGVTALWNWTRADGSDALLIGTGPSALLGLLERSALSADDGALMMSDIYGIAIDPIPGEV